MLWLAKIILLEKEWNNVFHVTCRSFRWNVLVCSCDPDHSSKEFEQSPKMFDLGVVCDFLNALWKQTGSDALCLTDNGTIAFFPRHDFLHVPLQGSSVKTCCVFLWAWSSEIFSLWTFPCFCMLELREGMFSTVCGSVFRIYCTIYHVANGEEIGL